MSIARALSNAMTGLTATARGTEVVAANLANMMTPGYARREMQVSPQGLGGNLGGVRIDGVFRAVNNALLSESRLANSAQSEVATRSSFLSNMEAVVGLPGEGHALTTALADFEAAMNSASARPDDELRLSRVVVAATTLAGRLNTASTTVQAARTSAEQSIAAEIDLLNASLERVAYLNRRISVVEAEGKDNSSLQDERQQIIDKISEIVPIQEVVRDGGKVSLFTRSGLVLLDGATPARFTFQPTGPLDPSHLPGAPLAFVAQEGTEFTPGQMSFFAGGSLAGHFAVRDSLAPALQRDLDTLAFDLQARLTDPAVDPTLATGQAGFFTDSGNVVDPALLSGLAGRLTLNSAVDPNQGGNLWKIRAGLGATSGDPVSNSTFLTAMSRAMDSTWPALTPGSVEAPATLSGRFGFASSRLSAARVDSEADLAVRTARLTTISSRLMADGVDSDAEMQRLLQYEQAYAANARVIRAIDEMINQLLRI